MTSGDFVTFLVLGTSDDGLVRISVHPARTATRLAISEGPHAANAGGQVGLTELLDESGTHLSPPWKPLFDAARLNWLVPHLVRLAAGKDIRESRLVKAYEQRHGYAPETEMGMVFGVTD